VVEGVTVIPGNEYVGTSDLTIGSQPQWRGNLFAGSLKDRVLVRLELRGEQVIHQEPLLLALRERIRDVRQGPDGYLYLLTDNPEGRLLRLEPAGA